MSMWNWEWKLIIPADWMSHETVNSLFGIVRDNIPEYVDRILIKFNDQLFRIGANWVNDIMEKNSDFSSMEDPKLHDIPQTVANWISQLSESWLAEKTEYITIHASGWVDMIKAAVERKKELWLNTKILCITVLTTLWEKGAQQSFDETAKHWVLKLAKLALESWADGMVCSPLEAPILRAVYSEKYPDFSIVTPWIRFADNEQDHQTRIKTPADWIEAADALVMGSPIVNMNKETWKPDEEKMVAAMKRFFKETDEINEKATEILYSFDKVLYTGTNEELLQHIGAFYKKPDDWKFCRLASGLLSNAYINIGATERNYLVLEKFSTEMASKLNKELGLDKVTPDKINEVRSDYVVMGAQMWSVRMSWYLAEKLWVEESIYTEKISEKEQKMDEILKVFEGYMADDIQIVNFTSEILSILDNPDYGDNMGLKRHDINLKWKKVILSEDIVTKWSTLVKMVELVEEKWWEVVWIACVWNRYWKDEFEWIPLISCYTPPAFELYWDENTPEEARGNHDELPKNSDIAEKPKNEWTELVDSMKK